MILIDELRHYDHGRKPGVWCHMASDTSFEELFVMAEALGLRREWIHVDHYDLSEELRDKAVSLGAVETTCRELAKRRFKPQ